MVSYGVVRNGNPRGNTEPIGRALVAKTGENQFLVTGAFCRVDFTSSAGGKRDFLRVEEGVFEKGVFHATRIGNGD